MDRLGAPPESLPRVHSHGSFPPASTSDFLTDILW